MGGTGPRIGWRPVAAIGAAAAYAFGATRFAPFTVPMLVATLLPVGVVVAVAVTRGRRPRDRAWPERPRPARGRTGWVVWAALAGAVVTVQLLNYVEGPRAAYPTLSSLAAQAFSVGGVRPVAFACWLGLGWFLVGR